MPLPKQPPPVMRTTEGDYVERNGEIIFVRWYRLTEAEQLTLWRRVHGGAMLAAGGTSSGFC